MELTAYQKLSPLFDADVYEAIRPETCVACRNSYGGTSYAQVEQQLSAAQELVLEEHRVISDLEKKQEIL